MIYVDSSFWIAAALRRDQRHAAAKALVARVGPGPLVTSNLVRGETFTFLRRRDSHPVAVAFLDSLDRSPRTRIERVESALEDEALAWLRRHDERPYSFVDATSFALMRALRIRKVLTFDEDFEAAGFDIVRA